MSEENQKDTPFTYTYSARQQEEVKRIRSKYVKQEENKMAQLRRLDQSVAKKGSAYAIAIGTISALVMGLGMCMVLVWQLMTPGILVGIAGIVMLLFLIPMTTGFKDE